MIDAQTQQTFDAFCDLTLPKSDWTHGAHLRVCWAALTTTRDPAATVELLRQTIRAYNTATGVENTATSGYHETLTQYFVGAVASLSPTSILEVVGSSRCSTQAPLRHWSRTLLFSPKARATWIEPDETPLPWPPAKALRTSSNQPPREHS
ncbi:hypothetical protein [Ilumatobacter sp.]|uniref:hypothetical protein n=1 Tax=Ilumatobacter sp. TaxID=1967498 RepID=UPI003752FE4B